MAKSYVALRPFIFHGHAYKAGDEWPGVAGRWVFELLNGQESVEAKGRLYVDDTDRFLREVYIYDGDVKDIMPIYHGRSILWYEYIGYEAALRETGMDVQTFELIRATMASRGTFEPEPEEAVEDPEMIAGYLVAELMGLSEEELLAMPRIGKRTAEKILAMQEGE